MQAPQLRPLAVGEVLDVSINVVLKNFWTLAKLVLVVVVPVQIVRVIVLASAVSNVNLASPGSSNAATTTHPGAVIGGYTISFVLELLSSALVTAACFKAISDAYVGGTPHWRESLRFAFGRLHSVVWLTLLAGFLEVIALLFLIVPGVWLWGAWSVAMPALLFEGCKGRKALGRSYRLVKGRWWPTFGALLVAYILAAVVGGIVGALVGAVSVASKNDVVGVLVVSAFSSIVTALVGTSFRAAVTAVIYYDLRVRKEGFDLQLLAERLGVRPPEGATAPAAAAPAPPPPPAAAPPGDTWGGQWQPPAPPAQAPPPSEWAPPRPPGPATPAEE